MPLVLDHVIIVVADLVTGAATMLNEYGLVAVEGGRHDLLGTENSIIPLGPHYLELLATRGDAGSADSPTRQVLATYLERGDRFMGWMVRTSDLDADAERHGLSTISMSRTRPDGRVLNWRLGLVADAHTNSSVPTFIQWDIPNDLHPAMTPVAHAQIVHGIEWIEVGGSPDRVRELVGDEVPVRFSGGDPGVRAVGVRTESGTVVIS